MAVVPVGTMMGSYGSPIVQSRTAYTPARVAVPGRIDKDRSETTDWRPTCAHNAEPVPAVVLDIFAGTGTVGLVAQSLSRRAVLIDLNAEYLRQCLERNRQTPLGLLA